MLRIFRSLRLCLLPLLLTAAPPLSHGQDMDSMSWLDNGHIRLGVDLSIGGSITWLSDAHDQVNVINSHDWGRQVQMSFYSGPVPYEPEGHALHPNWRFLGWNPIQSGDVYENRSRIVEHHNDGKTIHVRCIPMHWPLQNRPGECEFESWLTLEGRSVHVRSRLINRRDDDRTQYSGRHQELPAVYANGPWHKLMTYRGERPFTGDGLAEIPKQTHDNGIVWASWLATENWAALVDDDNWGLGVWNRDALHYIGGFAGGEPGQGGPKDSPTGYIAPVRTAILDHNIEYEYTYVLILDSLENIRQYVYDHRPSPALPAYTFAVDRRHWHYHQGHDGGWPPSGALRVTADGPELTLLGAEEFWLADPGHRIVLEAAVQAQGQGQTVQGRVFWKTFERSDLSADRSLSFEIPNDGQYHTITLEAGDHEAYRGGLTGLAVRPSEPCAAGDQFRLRRLAVEWDEKTAE